MGTPFQQKWVFKLLKFDFNVEYRKGKENKTDDTLSRLHINEEENLEPQANATSVEYKAVSTIKTTWLERLQPTYEQDPQLQQLINRCHQRELDL